MNLAELIRIGPTKLNYFDAHITLGITKLMKSKNGLEVLFKDLEDLDADAFSRWINIFRVVCYGTKYEAWGLNCILNEMLERPLSLKEVEDNKEELYSWIEYLVDALDNHRYGSIPTIRALGALEHENAIFAEFWRAWSIAVKYARQYGKISQSIPLFEMSNLLEEYTECPVVSYKRPLPKGGYQCERLAFPVWVRNWFHHSENEFEPEPPTRREIRLAARYLVELSFHLEMSDEEKRVETFRETFKDGFAATYKWLNASVWVSESRDTLTVWQENVVSGWSITVPYSEFKNSGKDLVDYVLELKRRAKEQDTEASY